MVYNEWLVWLEDTGHYGLDDGAGDALSVSPWFIFSVLNEFVVAFSGAVMVFSGSKSSGSGSNGLVAVLALVGNVPADGFGGIVSGVVEEFFNPGSGESGFFGNHITGPVFI